MLLSFRFMHLLPAYCSASLMFVVNRVPNKTVRQSSDFFYMGNSSVMDVALCTQKSTFWHQYLERYSCKLLFFMMQDVNMMS